VLSAALRSSCFKSSNKGIFVNICKKIFSYVRFVSCDAVKGFKKLQILVRFFWGGFCNRNVIKFNNFNFLLRIYGLEWKHEKLSAVFAVPSTPVTYYLSFDVTHTYSVIRCLHYLRLVLQRQ
jgi:hypothetical protein